MVNAGADTYLDLQVDNTTLQIVAKKAGNAGAVWNANTGGGMWGGPAYFMDSTGAQHIIYGGPINDYTVNLAPVGLSVQS